MNYTKDSDTSMHYSSAMPEIHNYIYRLSILIMSLLLPIGFTACDNQNKDASTENNTELKTNSIGIQTSPAITSQEFSRQQLEDAGISNWKLKVCELWKKNACISIESEACMYWQASDKHIGMTPELCVQAMNITLQQCETNQSFFQLNTRDCKCVENQYRETTKVPNTANQEGPLFVAECFVEE